MEIFFEDGVRGTGQVGINRQVAVCLPLGAELASPVEMAQSVSEVVRRRFDADFGAGRVSVADVAVESRPGKAAVDAVGDVGGRARVQRGSAA